MAETKKVDWQTIAVGAIFVLAGLIAPMIGAPTMFITAIYLLFYLVTAGLVKDEDAAKFIKAALLIDIYLELFSIAFRILLGGLLAVSGAASLGLEKTLPTVLTTVNGVVGLVEGLVLVIALILACEAKVAKLLKK